MILPFLTLICTGLCSDRELRRNESLPRPSLQAWPSSVVPPDSDVTLLCSAPTREADFALRKNNVLLESSPSPGSPEGLAEFHLTDVKSSSAGQYTCEYYSRERPNRKSLPSDALLLLVTGNVPKPSLQAQRRGKVTTGENVTLQCQMPSRVTGSYRFALLKKGTSIPIRLQHPSGKKTTFLLPSVTVDDTGDYSCVYYQPESPFWASEPSDPLSVCVTGVDGEAMTTVTSTEPAEPEYGSSDTLLTSVTWRNSDEPESPKAAGAPLGTTEIILAVTFSLLFLLAAFLICKYTRCGAALKKVTKSSRSRKVEEVATGNQPGEESGDASPAMKSCSPALDEGPPASRAEEPQGVTYAELNMRALSKGPSGQAGPPPETCVYSALKI